MSSTNPQDALDVLHARINALTAAIRESKTDDDRMHAVHMVYDVQQAAYDYAQARADRMREIYAWSPIGRGKIPVGPARIIDHPNTNGDEALARDLGVSL